LFGGAVLMMALVVGCSSSPEDTTMKEMISLNDQIIVEFEKVTDGPSFQQAFKKLAEMGEKANPHMDKFKSWTKEKQEEMKKKYESQAKAGEERLKKAVQAAAQKAGPDALKMMGNMPF
jgi:hypothetical protein